MLEQKPNNEKNADAANSQPAYCKTDVTSRFSSHNEVANDEKQITSLIPREYFDKHENLIVLMSALEKSVNDLALIGVKVNCEFDFDVFDKSQANVIEAYTLK